MRKRLFLLGKVLSAVLAAMTAVFVVQLIQMQMLSTEIIASVGAVLAVLAGLVLWLTWKGTGIIKMPVGLFLASLMLAALSVGILFVHKTLDTLDIIAAGDAEIVHVGIYVRSDDPNDYNMVALDYCHGILKEFDRESTDNALQQMTEKLGTEPKYQEHQRLPGLIDALLPGRSCWLLRPGTIMFP